ncbi:type II toxin-antitoxin system Phd/YefM family antitoxin [Chlorobium sp. KB01]|uniref:type II toxin-antitoxin system Phd/YefM family antitoxin n=1 Tax=Chlorobium sp. KB01 TaxID=1917528 RepID=UPI0009785935|nr:type II toxin-antitoxin system Phd/YefM family antitoxin [Chlorobium sp. KB01]
MHAIDTRNVTPLTDFRNNIKRYMEELSVSKKPLLLTQHGKSAAVLLDAEQYQKMLDQITFMQLVTEGLEEYRNNRTIPAEELFPSLDKIIAEAEKQ